MEETTNETTNIETKEVPEAPEVPKATLNAKGEYEIGSEVVYGIHGRCSVLGLETKEIGGSTIRFYKLQQIKKSPIPRPAAKNEPAIWLPVTSARAKGLRPPMDKAEADTVRAILCNQEFYFPLELKWGEIQKKLETVISDEGSEGLAKVMSYLYALKNRQIVPAKEVIRYSDLIHKQLVRELAEISDETIKATEDEVAELLKNKVKLDQ